MSTKPTKAFVPAAGLGERMRPLTDNCPKPLLVIDGKPMLDRILDTLLEAGVTDVVVNTHYLGQMIIDHLKNRKHPRITLSPETELLDTGGSVKKMLNFFGDEPFFVLNADVVWTSGKEPTLKAMADKWDSSKMDLLMLLHPSANVPEYAGAGDYYLADGSDQPIFAKGPDRRTENKPNYIYASAYIVHPRLFEGVTEKKFSGLQLFHKAEKAGRLYSLRHDGEWYHVGTPEAFAETNNILAKKRAG
jgi:MurNAc alpha-1-phosphate uridylyltransferase